MGKGDEPANPHDALFKWAFASPVHAEGELRHVLPAAIARQITWSSLQRRAGSFVDTAFRHRHTDLLFTVEVAGRPACIYVLLEHQSRSDALMPYRLLRYMVRIWEQWLADHKGAVALPPILPVVVHHDQRAWSAPLSMHGVLDADPAVLESLATHLPQFHLILDDLSVQDAAALHARSMSALGRLALLCLARARHDDALLNELQSWAALARQVLQAPDGVAAFAMLVRYILQVGKVPPDDLRHVLATQLGPGAEEAYMTGAEMLTREVREKALVQGRIDVVVRQLTRKFGPLSEPHIRRIQQADADTLDLWADRLLSADRIDEVFGK